MLKEGFPKRQLVDASNWSHMQVLAKEIEARKLNHRQTLTSSPVCVVFSTDINVVSGGFCKTHNISSCVAYAVNCWNEHRVEQAPALWLWMKAGDSLLFCEPSESTLRGFDDYFVMQQILERFLKNHGTLNTGAMAAENSALNKLHLKYSQIEIVITIFYNINGFTVFFIK